MLGECAGHDVITQVSFGSFIKIHAALSHYTHDINYTSLAKKESQQTFATFDVKLNCEIIYATCCTFQVALTTVSCLAKTKLLLSQINFSSSAPLLPLLQEFQCN
jgi:hypothetical protein